MCCWGRTAPMPQADASVPQISRCIAGCQIGITGCLWKCGVWCFHVEQATPINSLSTLTIFNPPLSQCGAITPHLGGSRPLNSRNGFDPESPPKRTLKARQLTFSLGNINYPGWVGRADVPRGPTDWRFQMNVLFVFVRVERPSQVVIKSNGLFKFDKPVLKNPIPGFSGMLFVGRVKWSFRDWEKRAMSGRKCGYISRVDGKGWVNSKRGK